MVGALAMPAQLDAGLAGLGSGTLLVASVERRVTALRGIPALRAMFDLVECF
jgi:hypothetical protein